MLLPKRGFYHPVAILVLATITLSFAVIFYLNSSVFFKAPETKPQTENTPTAPLVVKTTNEETANWKTFINKELGFLIKYPPDWKLDNGTVVYKGNKIRTNAPIDPYYAALAIYESTSVSAQDLCNLYECGQQRLNSESNFKISNVETNDASGLKVTISDFNGTYFLSSNGKVARINFGVIPERDKTLTIEEHKINFEMLEKIVSTFKFLD